MKSLILSMIKMNTIIVNTKGQPTVIHITVPSETISEDVSLQVVAATIEPTKT